MSVLCNKALPTFDSEATGALLGEESGINCMLYEDVCLGMHLGMRPDDMYIIYTFNIDEDCDCEPGTCECFNYELFDTLEEATDRLSGSIVFELEP